MHPLDLVTRRIGTQFYMGKATPIRHLRSRRVERAWWKVRYFFPRLWRRYLLWRMPESHYTAPPRNESGVWFEGNVYDVMQRVTLSIDPHVGMAWLDIQNWVEDKEDALWFGPPRHTHYLLDSDEGAIEQLREMLDHAQALLTEEAP